MKDFKPVILIFCMAAFMYGLSYVTTFHWAHEEFSHSLARGISYFLFGCGVLVAIGRIINMRK